MAEPVLSTGEQMRAWRELLGWNQRAMALRLRMDQSAYSRAELGRIRVRESTLLLFRLLQREYREGRLGRWPDA